MKPHEIYNLWVLFDKATSDPAFSSEQKLSIGRDMLAALPPDILCSSSKPSLAVVTEAMEGRLNEINTRSAGKASRRTGAPAVAGAEGIHAEDDAGNGLPDNGLVDPSESAQQAKAKSANKRRVSAEKLAG